MQSLQLPTVLLSFYYPTLPLLHFPTRRKSFKPNWDYSVYNPLPDDVITEMRAGYAASVTLLDYSVGKVLQAVRNLGLEESTIVVLHGDHGYSLGEHGHYEKSTLFESG